MSDSPGAWLAVVVAIDDAWQRAVLDGRARRNPKEWQEWYRLSLNAGEARPEPS